VTSTAAVLPRSVTDRGPSVHSSRSHCACRSSPRPADPRRPEASGPSRSCGDAAPELGRRPRCRRCPRARDRCRSQPPDRPLHGHSTPDRCLRLHHRYRWRCHSRSGRVPKPRRSANHDAIDAADRRGAMPHRHARPVRCRRGPLQDDASIRPADRPTVPHRAIDPKDPTRASKACIQARFVDPDWCLCTMRAL